MPDNATQISYEVVFNTDGTVHFVDLPEELFPLVKSLGSVPPDPRISARKMQVPHYILTRGKETPLQVDDLPMVSMSQLWAAHEGKMGGESTSPRARASLLDVKAEIARRSLMKCDLCEMMCGVNRWEGERGKCGSGRLSYVARYFLNWGEERHLIPAITISLAGCNWHCVYCQYAAYLDPLNGHEIEPHNLSATIYRLWQQGGITIQWIGGNPDQHIWAVLSTLQLCQVPIPVVWNTNGYASEVSIRLLEGVVDTYIIDFRYGPGNCDVRYGAPRESWRVITRNLALLANQNVDIIIRHLQLPGHFDCCTTPVLRWIAINTPNASVNLLNGQYRPAHLAHRFPELTKRLPRSEIERAYKLATELGLQLIS